MKSEPPNLQTVLQQHEIELEKDACERIDRYCFLLWDHNSRINLTRHTDYEKFVARDLMDAIELGRLLQPNEHVLDIGSGGGVPGILLAILRPDLQICLSESVTKKAKVLAEMIQQLHLDVPVFADRAENALTTTSFDSVVARAVGPMWKILHWLESSWSQFERLLLIKGPNWVNERKEARHRGKFGSLQLRKLHSYPMIGNDSESVILEIRSK